MPETLPELALYTIPTRIAAPFSHVRSYWGYGVTPDAENNPHTRLPNRLVVGLP